MTPSQTNVSEANIRSYIEETEQRLSMARSLGGKGTTLVEIVEGEKLAVYRELLALRAANRWQPIESAPKYKEVLVYRYDAGVMLGIYTSPDQLTPENQWDETATELGDSFEKEDWFLFCADGVERVEGSDNPTHWMPLPTAPEPTTHNQESVP